MKRIIKGLNSLIIITIAVLLLHGCNKNDENNNKIASKATINLSGVDFSKIHLNNGQIEFASWEDYGQTIEQLLQICNKFSTDYIVALEKQYGKTIDEIDDDEVANHQVADDFFPFNPLQTFVERIGFSNSLYPLLRAQEIEWLRTTENLEDNPFDVKGFGYVQSALHNTDGNVMIAGELYNPEIYKLKNTTICRERGEHYKDLDFYYDGKVRRLKGMLSTTPSQVHGKTGVYYKNSSGNHILWLKRVYITTSGNKYSDCDGYWPVQIPTRTDNSGGGITEVYTLLFTHFSTPTKLHPYQIGIHGVHKVVYGSQNQGMGTAL